MSKVTFEFDEYDDSDDINIVVNRNKLTKALYDLSDYRRTILKGYENGAVIALDDKILGKISDKIPEEYDNMPTKILVSDEAILDELNRILTPIYNLLQ